MMVKATMKMTQSKPLYHTLSHQELKPHKKLHRSVWGFLKSLFSKRIKIKQFDPMSFEMGNLVQQIRPKQTPRKK